MKRVLIGIMGLASIAILLGATAPADTEPPQAEPQADTATTIVNMDMAKIMKKCKMCHGKDLMGKQKKKKKTPAILGLSKAKLLKSMTTKIPKPMKAIAKTLTDEEKNEVVNLISKMPKPATP